MIRQFLASLLLLLAASAMAGTSDALASCYSQALPPAKGASSDAELFVIIDQTTLFDSTLRQSVADNVKPFLRSGSSISVTEFSAFTQGHYTSVVVTAHLDPDLDQELRNQISKPLLARFDQCKMQQPQLAAQAIGSALRAAFGGESSAIERSDILFSLKDISGRVRQSPAKRRIILLASDMLENSSITSFYLKNAVRHIDPEKELGLVKRNDMFGDFGGAEVYVIGAGLLAEDATVGKSAYRSPQIMQALKSFWTSWFATSKATVVEFGQPALLSPIR